MPPKSTNIVKNLLDGLDVDKLKADIKTESSKAGEDIAQKKLSENELILRMSVVKSVCSLRTGTNRTMDKIIEESEKLLKWVKSL